MKSLATKIKTLLGKETFWKYACLACFIIVNIMYFYLAIQKTFHYDEAYSVGMIHHSFGEIIDITAQDVHSPFYYFLLKLFCMIPGLSPLTGSKLFSWLFMVLYMVFGGKIISKKYGWNICFYWLLLSGFVPSMMIQATTVRMYTMSLFFVTVASYLAYSLYQKESLKKWILFTVFSVAAVYSHTFSMLGMVAVYGIFLFVALFHKKFKLSGKVALSGVVVSVCFLPWLFSLWTQFRRLAGVESGWQVNFGEVTLNSAITYLSEWFSSMENPEPKAVIFGTALLLYASYHARKYMEEKKDILPGLGMIVAGIILTVGILVSIYVNPCFLGRYLFPLFGGVWLFVAVGIAKCGGWWKQLIIIVLILFFGTAAFKEEVRLENTEGLETYQNYVESEMVQEKSVIMADRYFALLFSVFYPDLDYMVYGYGPECLPFDNVEVFQDWAQLDEIDTVYFISFTETYGDCIGERYELVECFTFEYSYYTVQVSEMVKKEGY